MEALKNKTTQELTSQLTELRTELAETQRSLKMNELKNVRKVRQLKREIARCLTIMNNPRNTEGEEK